MSRENHFQKLWDRRIVRFLFVGIINTITDTALLNVLHFVVGLKFIIANIISASISITISYFWNHYLVFRKEHAMTPRLFLKFIIVTGISVLAVQSAVIYILQKVLTLHFIGDVTGLAGAHVKFVQLNGIKLIAVFTAMVWNFALYQLVVFRKPVGTEIAEEGIEPF